MTQATAGNLAAETSGHRAVCLPSQTAQDSQRPEMQKRRRGDSLDSLDHDRLSYSRSHALPRDPATDSRQTTHMAHHTEAQSVLHASPLELWDWSHPNDLPTGDTSESSRAQGGPHSVPVIQSSPPTYESFPSRMEEARHICSHLCIYWLPQVNRQGTAWAGPQKYMGPE